MSTLYVISNETNKVVAVITGSDDEKCHEKYMTEYGSNDYSYSFNDRGVGYSKNINKIEIEDNNAN